MRILTLHLSREFLRMVVLLLACFVATYTLFDFLEKVDNFYEAKVPVATMLYFFLLQVPELTALLAPMAILMATIITLGLMVKRNEIVSIKNSGVSMFRFTLPIVLISLSASFAVALLNESVVPGTKSGTNYIWEVVVNKRARQLHQRQNFWHKGNSSIYRVGYYHSGSQTLTNVTYYRFDQQYNLSERIDALRARFVGGRWIFFSGLYQERQPDGNYEVLPFDERVMNLPERPADFSHLSKPSEEMSLAELAAYVRKVEGEGFDSRRYRVDLHSKLSFPFVCLIMALLGIPLVLREQRREAMALAITLGLVAALSYWISFSYVRSLFGYSGILPPILAAWLPNGVFGLVGLWMFVHVRQ